MSQDNIMKPDNTFAVLDKVRGKCGKPCEVYSRVVGYHRPIKNWNKGKKEEFKQRKVFVI